MREPNPAAVDWRSQAALAHAALDQPDAALALAREELELARRFGAARAIGIALRTLGVIGDELDHLNEAVDVLAASPARLEHARALADLGVALRHRRRIVEAREPLRQALDLAIRCGATPLAERARTELLIAGARPRRPQLSGVDALTTNERRVAALAAEGRSNREIAQALYVSHKTVEKHLTAAYRKLGVERARGPAGARSQKSRAPSPYPRRCAAGMLDAMSKPPASSPDHARVTRCAGAHPIPKRWPRRGLGRRRARDRRHSRRPRRGPSASPRRTRRASGTGLPPLPASPRCCCSASSTWDCSRRARAAAAGSRSAGASSACA